MKMIRHLKSRRISKYDRSIESELFYEIIDTLSDIEIVGIEGLEDGFFR